MPNAVLDTIKARSPGEWGRIRPRITIDADGDEIVRGIRDIAFVARVSRKVIMAALRGGQLGVPRLDGHRFPGASNSPAATYWWCYLESIMEWRRAYTGKSLGCVRPFDPEQNEPLNAKFTTVER